MGQDVAQKQAEGQWQSIQALRALAAVLVVLFHEIQFYGNYSARVGAPTPVMAEWYFFRDFGGIGVPIFFVISGFIMAALHERTPGMSLGGFLGRRLTRLVPLYWLLTLMMAVRTPGLDPVLLVKSLLFVPVEGYFPLLGVGWTLNLEMFFYAVFAVVVVWLRASILWVGAVFAACALGGALTGAVALRFYGDPIVWTFFAGLVVHRIHRHPWVLRLAPALVMAALALMVHAVMTHLPDSVWGLRQLLPWGLPSVLLVLGAVALEGGGRGGWLFGLRPVRLIGDASYSLYLVHALTLGSVTLVIFKAKPHLILGPDITLLLLTAMCCLLAYGTHRLVELPMIRAMRGMARKIRNRRAEALEAA